MGRGSRAAALLMALYSGALSAGVPPPEPLLDEMFQDHAVLQRDRPIPVWGGARANEKLSVAVDGAAVATRADATGHWKALLPALPAGGPHVLTVSTDAGARRTVTDLLVGDVYLCSGQSNMELSVQHSIDGAREAAESANDSIRLLSVAHASHPAPLSHFETPVAWTAAAPASVRDFSAACYYFARELQKTVPVPLGLIHSSWGGSRIEPWLSEAGLRSVGGFDHSLELLHGYAVDAAAGNARWGAEWQTWWHAHAEPDSAPWNAAAGPDWHAVPEPMRDWKTWGVPELASHDGMVWFRRSVTLSAAQAASAATLSIGAIDEIDETWVNGRPIANSFGYGTERTYALPAGVLRAGENVVVINVLSTWDAGGMYGPPDHLALRFADGSAVPLGGDWRYQLVPERMGYPPRAPWASVNGQTTIHNAMIAPLGPYGLRGVLWYQGESNTDDAGHYQALLTGLMGDWRRQFGNTTAFLIVQLPNFGAPVIAPAESGWADLREAQRRAVAADGNAALAVTIDLGDPRNLHPPDKQAVGARLARAARHLLYGEAVSASGATPRAARRDGAHVIVALDALEGPLSTYSAGRPTAFEVCAAARGSCRFVDAAAQDRTVVLDAAGIPATRVRYCWGDAPLCNLYDRSGLPVGPFEISVTVEPGSVTR